ncbi:MAG: helix-turn-helix domain-containing protein [Patescibacteria group bacterium]|nr:excisionase family DNA-binding protein [Patescibacteria group bacterium]MDE1966107.1 helix-turn-helix domain-containing protein [Patescibacteria group bacterium]
MNDKGAKTIYISTTELAKMLGISRVAVFKKIKKGEIPAEKIGRNYAIAMEYVHEILGGMRGELNEARKKEISEAVAKVVKEYGETLRLLGKE